MQHGGVQPAERAAADVSGQAAALAHGAAEQQRLLGEHPDGPQQRGGAADAGHQQQLPDAGGARQPAHHPVPQVSSAGPFIRWVWFSCQRSVITSRLLVGSLRRRQESSGLQTFLCLFPDVSDPMKSIALGAS